MSGLKISAFEFREELEKLSEAVSEGAKLYSKLQVLAKQIEKSVQECREKEIDVDLAGSSSWIEAFREVQKPEGLRSLPYDEVVEALKSAEKSLESFKFLYSQGKTELARLQACLAEDHRKRELLKVRSQLEELKGTLQEKRDSIEHWKTASYLEMVGKIDQLSRREAETAAALDALKEEVEKTEFRIKEILDKTEHLERLDKKRRLVLRALQKTCWDLGWDVQDCRQAIPGDPSSPVIFQAIAYGFGNIEFTLSLDTIQVEAPQCMDRVCMADFSKISEKLYNFGLKTNFTKPDGSPLETKIAKKAKRLAQAEVNSASV